jgi:methylated-DNA-[protein]-cysteine S-methyltransferase
MTHQPGTALLDTPLGPLAVVVDGDGSVLASGFGPLEDLLTRLNMPSRPGPAAATQFGGIVTAVRRYFDGDLRALDGVPVRQPGGAFRQAAWAALRQVEPGQPISYAELARRAGSPGAARAAGQACARNRVAPFVPCHRVVPSGGGVGGYAYGAAVKSGLLRHERGPR